jgi:hypothetical protein
MEEQAGGVDLVRGGGAEDVTITAACVRRSGDLSKPLAFVSQSSRSDDTRRQIIVGHRSTGSECSGTAVRSLDSAVGVMQATR